MEVFWPAQVNFQSQQTTSTIQLSLTTTLGRSLDQYQSSLLVWNQLRNNTKNYYRHIPALPNHPQVVLHGRYGDGNLRKNNSVALEVVSGISETFKIFWARFNFSLDPFNHNPEQEALVTPPTSSESKSGSPAGFSLTSSCSHILRWSKDYFVRSLGSLAPTRNLENESVYDVRVLATNRLGNSNFSKVFNFYVKTTREPQFDRKKICNEAFFCSCCDRLCQPEVPPDWDEEGASLRSSYIRQGLVFCCTSSPPPAPDEKLSRKSARISHNLAQILEVPTFLAGKRSNNGPRQTVK